MKSNIYCPYIVINQLHAATSCCKVIKRLEQIHRCYMAKLEFPRFADVGLWIVHQAMSRLSAFADAIAIHMPFSTWCWSSSGG